MHKNSRRWHSRQTIIFISDYLASITSKPVNRQWLETPGFIGKTLGGFNNRVFGQNRFFKTGIAMENFHVWG